MAHPRRPLPFALATWTVLCMLGLPAVAAAQGMIAVSLISIEGRDDDSFLGEVSVGVAECETDAEMVFRLDNLPDKSSLDVYVGDDCNTDRTLEETNCELVASESIDDISADFDLTLLVSEIVAAQGYDCDAFEKREPTIWFLAVDSANSREDVGTNYGIFPGGQVTEFSVDLKPPSAPTGLSGGSGESQIPIDWESDETDLERFLVYVDSSVSAGSAGDGGNAECNSSRLRAGISADAVPSSLLAKTINEGTATGTDLSGGDIDGDLAAVAVVAVDIAGNESELSNVACVRVVPTDGFWDVYESSGGDVATGCPCSAIGPPQLAASWPIALSLGFLVVRRRRRRAP